MASVGIIILNYNSTRLTKKCVQSLLSVKDKEDEYHIIIFDNDSKLKPKEEDFPHCDVVHSQKNLGFAEGNNTAVSHLLREKDKHIEYLLFLNNDTRVVKGLVRELVSTFEKTRDAGMIVPKIYFEKKHEYHQESYEKNQLGKVLWYAGGDIDWANMILTHRGVDEVDRGQFDGHLGDDKILKEIGDTLSEPDMEFATGCCFLTTPVIWKKLRGFDTRYFLYYEDADLSIRLQKKLKKRIIFEPKAVLYHLNAGSSQGSGSGLHQYYQTRNRLRFGLQYGSRRTKIALLLEARRLFFHGDSAVKLGILDSLGGKWGNQSHRIKAEKQ